VKDRHSSWKAYLYPDFGPGNWFAGWSQNDSEGSYALPQGRIGNLRSRDQEAACGSWTARVKINKKQVGKKRGCSSAQNRTGYLRAAGNGDNCAVLWGSSNFQCFARKHLTLNAFDHCTTELLNWTNKLANRPEPVGGRGTSGIPCGGCSYFR